MKKLLLVTVLVGSATQAQPASRLDATASQAIVQGCVTHSTARGQSHAIVVVDSGGHVIASLRMDGNGYGVMDFALAKARASAAWGVATARGNTPGFANAPHVVTVPGGVPVFSADGRTRLGAVGVSGEPPPDDVACAEVGIAAAGLRSAPAPR
ncbi:heme-binding protein [Sphingosinicella sp. YJ22]|uniref:heme-binding protein n=1 Tax=Sphingosinicella sp. YJ22 TaxID=1104780 RepID=UPI001409651F|nr:heme-binding protein [Sphingosinicella sp. YJ22]